MRVRWLYLVVFTGLMAGCSSSTAPGEGGISYPPRIFLTNEFSSDNFYILDAENLPNSVNVLSYTTLADEIYEGMYVSGGYAYVPSSSGLLVVDVSSDSASVVSSFNNPLSDYGYTHVLVDGNYGYLTAVRSIHVVDVSRPDSLVLVGSYTAPDSMLVDNLAKDGSLLFTVDMKNIPNYFTRIIDVSDPASPVEVGQYSCNALIADLDAQNGYLFLACTDSGLVIVDVSSPSSPSMVYRYTSSFYAKRVAVNGNYAYAVFSNGSVDSLFVFDISSPASARKVASLYIPNFVWAAFLYDDYYLLAAYQAFYVVDVSNPDSPSIALEMNLPYSGVTLDVFAR